MQITRLFRQSVQTEPNTTATLYLGRRRTYAEVEDRVSRLAAGLIAQGIRPGDRVAMVSPNSDKLFEVILATLWAGAVAVPLNTRLNEREIASSIADSDASLLLLSEEFSALAATKTATVKFWNHDANCPLEAIISAHSPSKDQQRGGEDLAFILYTGGTTGKPKGVMLSHRAIVAAAANQSAGGCGTQGDVYLHVAPMFHMADIQLMANHLLGGGTHVFLPGFDPSALQDLVSHENITDVLLVPTMIQSVISHPEFRADYFHSLKTIFYGASPMPSALLERSLKALPECQFIQGYGMTETCLATMLPARFHKQDASEADVKRMRSAGYELPLVELRITDPNGNTLPDGEIGEIQIRSPSVMKGYWRQEEKTAIALENGWMHTEDMAYRDERGFIQIVDRSKDMIITGGENVYSQEVENIICEHPAVAQCAVVGLEDEKWGELVHAEVQLREGETLTEETLNDFCKAQLSGFKCPRSIRFTTTLPLSSAGKILKSEIRKAGKVERGADKRSVS